MLGPACASPGRSASCASASGAKTVPQKTGAARLRDATDDPTHGEQEGSFYRGYHETHMYHPLVVFDGARRTGCRRRSREPATPTPAAAPSRSRSAW